MTEKWVKRKDGGTERELTTGMILRTPVSEKNPAKGYLYGVCHGSGFGCTPGLIGNAIFVTESHSIEEARQGKGRNVRWERYWSIEILEGETANAERGIY